MNPVAVCSGAVDQHCLCILHKVVEHKGVWSAMGSVRMHALQRLVNCDRVDTLSVRRPGLPKLNSVINHGLSEECNERC
jgi:hypothetical protein